MRHRWIPSKYVKDGGWDGTDTCSMCGIVRLSGKYYDVKGNFISAVAPSCTSTNGWDKMEVSVDYIYDNVSKWIRSDQPCKLFINDKFSFGKYHGLSVKDVAVKDPGYLSWLCTELRFELSDGVRNLMPGSKRNELIDLVNRLGDEKLEEACIILEKLIKQ